MWGLLAVLITNDDATLPGQLTGLGAILGYTFIASLLVWFLIKMVFGIRLSDEEQWGRTRQRLATAYPEFSK